MSIKRLYAILLVLVLLVTGVGAYTAQARPNAATTQFNTIFPINADVVINGADGGEGIDGDGGGSYCYLTQAAAITYSPGTPDGIPDNGLIPANAFHPAVQLSVNNTNDGFNARKVSPAGPLTFDINVPDDNYFYVHIFGVTGSGSSSFNLTFNYSDTTSTTTGVVTLEDWYNDFTDAPAGPFGASIGVAQSADHYNLIDGLDRMQCNVAGYQDHNDPAIFGHRFAADANKTLQTITVTVSNLTGGERANFFGAIGETPATVTIEQDGGQADPTSASPINFAVVFSEAVTGFDNPLTDVTLSGTAGATTAVITGGPTTYTVAVSGMTSEGTVIASIPAGAAQNSAGSAGIGNLASTSADNTVTYGVAPGPPQVSTVNTNTDTGDGILAEGEIATVGITQLLVKFNEDMDDTSVGDRVTDVANYLLLSEGTVAGFQTTSCRDVKTGVGVDPGDAQVTINSVTYDNVTFTATLNLASALPDGLYQLFACGTATLQDLAGNDLAGNGVAVGTDFIRNFSVALPTGGGGAAGGAGAAATLPATGFPMGKVTRLPVQPTEKAYTNSDMVLEIPSLGQTMTIVGVPQSEGSWDVTWLGNNAGYLAGSAFPTWNGNTVITGHVWDAWNQPGPFAELKTLKYGDQFYIHAWGMTYTYEVRQNRLLFPYRVSAAFEHEELDWVTLMTCEYYNPFKDNYLFRRMVRAVLVSAK